MKEGAFSNTSTGYARPSKSRSSGRNKSTAVISNENKNNTETTIDDLDKDFNSGFGNYLRSDEGVEMMKLFVFANTIVIIITMAWPHIREQYYWFREWFENFQQPQID